jgi:FkbM family methyltransferase
MDYIKNLITKLLNLILKFFLKFIFNVIIYFVRTTLISSSFKKVDQKNIRVNILLFVENLSLKIFKILKYKVPIFFDNQSNEIFYYINGIYLNNQTTNRYRKLQNPDDQHIEWNLLYKNLLLTKKKLTIIDCGSNNGEVSIFFSKKFSNSKIFSIEASKKNFQISKKNVDYNNCNNIRLFNLALSDVNNKLHFVKYDSAQSGVQKKYSPGFDKVKSITLSKFIFDNKIKNIDLLKVDIENSTYKVLPCILKNQNIIKQMYLSFEKANSKYFVDFIAKVSNKFYLYYLSNKKLIKINKNSLIKMIDVKLSVQGNGIDVYFDK